MLGEEADGQEYLVPEERWSSKCRTCKSLLGVVCSSSARVKFFGEGGRDHIDLVQHAYDESRSMLFIGASSLVKGAIDIMFDPGRVCYVDLRVRPNVDHLAGITGIAVPGTKASVFHTANAIVLRVLSFVERWGFSVSPGDFTAAAGSSHS